MNDYIYLLHQVPLFAELPDTELEILADNLNEVTYPPETVLFKEGERGDRFYIILEGNIAIIKALGKEDERVLGIRGPGEFIGEMSLLNRDGLRTACAVVREGFVRVLEMTRKHFDMLLVRRPIIAYEMLRVLSMRLREANNKAIHDLKEKNIQLSKAFADLQAAQEQIIQKESLEKELEQAYKIQQSMLPKVLPQIPGIDLGARMDPARMVGGDFYDLIQLEANKLGIVVGDVSGKGIPAALFMALNRSLLRVEAKPDCSPDRVLHRVNQLLLKMNASGLFATVLYGVLDCTTRAFTYTRAAHEPPLIWKQDGTLVAVQPDQGVPIGMFPVPLLQTQTITLPPNGLMLIFTDGVTEVANPAGEFFGLKGIYSFIPSHLQDTAQELCNHLVEQAMSFQGSSEQADDITLVAVRVKNG